ncbi:hypothetical protein C0992_007528 [Termitomyces sp. T32_za158]|nr:hypothetical protein C0992_007528 [Termitomyces sp. T32_za158]
MAARNKIIRRLWEEESDLNVRAEVEKHLTELSKVREEENVKDKRTAEQYAKAIKDVAPFVGRILHGLQDRTGWSFTVLMGGPDPNMNGDINVASFHVGKNASGLEFGDAHSNFEHDYMTPFTEFLTQAYSPEVRRARALGFKIEKTDKEEDNIEVGNGLGSDTVTTPTTSDTVSPTPASASTTYVAPASDPSTTSELVPSSTAATLIPSPSVTAPVPNSTPPNSTPPAPSPPNLTPPAPSPVAAGSLSPTPVIPVPAAPSNQITPFNFAFNNAYHMDNHSVSYLDKFLDTFDTEQATGNGPDNFNLQPNPLDNFDWNTFNNFLSNTSMLPSMNSSQVDFSAANADSASSIVSIPAIPPPIPAPTNPPSTSAPSGPAPSAISPSLSLNSPSASTSPHPASPEGSSDLVEGPLAPVSTTNDDGPRSRSGRHITVSKRADQMNQIGTSYKPPPTGKENIVPDTVVRAEWRIAAESYLSLTDLGNDWKKLIEAWISREYLSI